MKNSLQNQRWIIILASLALAGIGAIQANWMYRGYQLQAEERNLRLKELTPQIAKTLKEYESFSTHQVIETEEPLMLDTVDQMIDSMMLAAGFSEDYYYAFFQNKKQGTYRSNTTELEAELRQSDFRVCVTCIVSFHIFDGPEEEFNAENLNRRRSPARVGMTTIRSVEETLKLPSDKRLEDILWFSLYVPNSFTAAVRSIFVQLFLTLLLMSLLVALFGYTLRTLQRQKKISQVKDDFFNNMTHEFKTPLSSIRLAASLLKGEVEPSKKNIYLHLIENESKKLEGQVDKILQLSSIESQEMILDKKLVNLHVLIEEVIQRLELIIQERQATVDVLLNLEQPEVEVDAAHFSNCIYNLIENALKYSAEFPKITVSTFSKNGQVMISIKDVGKGIEEEHRPEIFDRFYRAQKKDTYQGKGFGIGLSYVKTIVEAHEGKVFLNEKYQNGCEFMIVLS